MNVASKFRGILAVRLFLLTIVSTATAKYSGGTGEPNDPYQIGTAEDLMLLGETPADYDKHFVLTANIDLDPNLPGRKVFDKAVVAPDVSLDAWGRLQGTPFTGVFDGSGYTILHLTIKGESCLGLFGRLGARAEIKGLGVVDVNVAGSGIDIGGLAGGIGLWDSGGGVVTECYTTGSVGGMQAVGGLAGQNCGTVTRCHSDAMISGNTSIGGLVGNNVGTLSQCHSTAAVRGIWDDVGGLAGENHGTVTQSCTTGTVSGANTVGGLVGGNSGSVSNSYSTSAVSGGECVGGLVGDNSITGIDSPTWRVVHCYSTGVVKGDSYVGGLVGDDYHSGVWQCVWDVETSGVQEDPGAVGLTTAQMMDPYMLGLNGFARDPNWVLDADHDYPRLAWQETPGHAIAEPNIHWMDGHGTPTLPYRIETTEQLTLLGRASALWDKHFVVGADLDLAPNLPDTPVFGRAVVASFRGVLDGGGHVIRHLTVNGSDYLGLIGRLERGAQVRNLGMSDVSVTGSGYSVGGLVGRNDGTVFHCYSTGAVAGQSYVGGLVGQNTWASAVSRCYSTCSVRASGEYGSVGGLVGRNEPDATMSQCYSAGPVSGNKLVGGLVGCNDRGLVTGSFWDLETSGQASSGGGTGLTTAGMQDLRTYLSAGWDFVGEKENGVHETWQMPEGIGYPVLGTFHGFVPPRLKGAGTPEDPYLVSDAMELGAMVYYDPSASYQLGAAIDLSGIHWGEAVIPRFDGTFDGNDFAISRLTIKGPGNLGLFGQVESGGEVLDLGVVDVNIIGSGNLGGLVGMNLGGTLTECYCTGSVSVNGGSYVGGLVGSNAASIATVNGCYSTVVIAGSAWHVGGLVGYNDGTVTQSYSSAVISGSAWSVGGLVGCNDGSVTESYSIGVVSGTAGDIGGLVGSHWYDATVIRCFSIAVVTGGSSAGGLVGGATVWFCDSPEECNAVGLVTKSFWDTQTSGQATSAGGTGKTTAEMQTAKTFLDAGWDFVGETGNGTEDIWWILEGQDYPRLWWEQGDEAPK